MATTRDHMIEKLQEFTGCDVSDGLCKFGHGTGGFLPGLTMWSPMRQSGDKVIGPAYIVKYVPIDELTPKLQNHYIDTVPEGAVIFISSPPTANAVYGGLMSTRAIGSGAVGAVIDGRFRDLEEQRALGFPVRATAHQTVREPHSREPIDGNCQVFAKDTGTAPPYAAVKVVAVNKPLKLQIPGTDATVNPGDYIIADLNGVVVLPRGLAEDVLPLMKKQVEPASKMAEAIKHDELSFPEASRKFR